MLCASGFAKGVINSHARTKAHEEPTAQAQTQLTTPSIGTTHRLSHLESCTRLSLPCIFIQHIEKKGHQTLVDHRMLPTVFGSVWQFKLNYAIIVLITDNYEAIV